MLSEWLKNKEGVDFKKKFFLLLAVIIASFCLVFFLAISPTIQLYAQYNEVAAQYQQMMADSKLPEYKELQQEAIKYSGNDIYKEIAGFCSAHSLKLSYYSPVVSMNGKVKTETYKAELSGTFHDIVQLAYFIEREKKLGKIVSLQYETKKNSETRHNYLFATLYLQTIKVTDDEV